MDRFVDIPKLKRPKRAIPSPEATRITDKVTESGNTNAANIKINGTYAIKNSNKLALNVTRLCLILLCLFTFHTFVSSGQSLHICAVFFWFLKSFSATLSQPIPQSLLI